MPPLFFQKTPSVKKEQIQLKDCIECAKNPIKFYFNRVLGIYLREEEEREEEEFILSNIYRSILRKGGAQTGALNRFTSMQRKEDFRLGC